MYKVLGIVPGIQQLIINISYYNFQKENCANNSVHICSVEQSLCKKWQCNKAIQELYIYI